LTARDWCGITLWGICALVGLRALHRVLPPDVWEGLLLVGVLLALVVAAAFAPEIDSGEAPPVDDVVVTP
jgi:hypothetical protein